MISLTIPTAFDEDGVIFACAYLAVIVVHSILYTQSASWTVAAVWLARPHEPARRGPDPGGAIIGGAGEYVLWGLAVSIFVIIAVRWSPRSRAGSGRRISWSATAWW